MKYAPCIRIDQAYGRKEKEKMGSGTVSEPGLKMVSGR
jgi:hypothetical protein